MQTTEEFSEIQFQRWGKIRHAFSDWSLEDIYTLDKAMTLKDIDTYWEMGLAHIAKLQMLQMRYSYDHLLSQIYDYMFREVNQWFREKYKWGHTININDISALFEGQPLVYNENITVENPRTILYNVKQCSYKKRLQKKYPKKFGLIEDLVNL